MVDFKKTYLLGKPIQYVQLNDAGEEEISALNSYVRYENKKAKDMLIYEDVLACGRGFRYVAADGKTEKDEAPFEIINCPADKTEVIYSNGLGHKQLFSYIITDMEYVDSFIDENGEQKQDLKEYEEYTIYLKDMRFVLNNRYGELKFIENSIAPIISKEHSITEYYLNEKRIGLIEIGKDLFNDINYLESLDKDDMEQFVNAIMVFTNAEVSSEDLQDIKELGAVCINSTEQKKASIDLLQGRLNANDTQTYYTRLLTALHQILGVPIASDSGEVTSGDTGKAKLISLGHASAGIRSEGDQTMFGMCDLNSLKTLLSICRNATNSKIKNLKVSEVDTRFQRDMSDNLLIKTQGLLNLYDCDIPRKYANSIINLFGDPSAVTKEQERLFGEQVSKQGSKNSNENQTQKIVKQDEEIKFGENITKTTNRPNSINEQNNKIQDISEINNQEQ